MWNSIREKVKTLIVSEAAASFSQGLEVGDLRDLPRSWDGGRKWESRRAFQRLLPQESWGGRRWAEVLVKPRPEAQAQAPVLPLQRHLQCLHGEEGVLPPRSIFLLLTQKVLTWRKWNGEKVSEGVGPALQVRKHLRKIPGYCILALTPVFLAAPCPLWTSGLPHPCSNSQLPGTVFWAIPRFVALFPHPQWAGSPVLLPPPNPQLPSLPSLSLSLSLFTSITLASVDLTRKQPPEFNSMALYSHLHQLGAGRGCEMMGKEGRDAWPPRVMEGGKEERKSY